MADREITLFTLKKGTFNIQKILVWLACPIKHDGRIDGGFFQIDKIYINPYKCH